MKVIVTVKRVTDPEKKIVVLDDGSGIKLDQMKYVPNPFDQIAVEEALRLKGDGEVIIVSIGEEKAKNDAIRLALAMGADRGILVKTEDNLDPLPIARILQKVVEREQPDLVLMGKQAIDDDSAQVPQMLAELLQYGQATFASKEDNLESAAEKAKQPGLVVEDGSVICVREVDGGLETLKVKLPAIVSVDLRLNQPRYASLPGIMKAKKKPIEELTPADLGADVSPALKIRRLHAPSARSEGQIVPDVATLVDKLRNEAKVL